MKICFVHPRDLSVLEVEEMYLLTTIHFEDVHRDRFETGLQQSDRVLLIQDLDSGLLKGFSPLWLRRHPQGSGWCVFWDATESVLDPTLWPRATLPGIWLGVAQALHRLHPTETIHWLFGCDSYRAYRLMAMFWREFYPRHNQPTPHAVEGLMQTLLGTLRHSCYDASGGIVQACRGDRRRKCFQELAQPLSPDLHTQFFMKRNPGYLEGDRLVCYAEIAPRNLTAMALRRWHNNPLTARLIQALMAGAPPIVNLPVLVG